ncbi:MAG: NAD-binding protein, partial [Clostridia bacterium]|nr:NAD-binding protein [Clostridia bacterium]
MRILIVGAGKVGKTLAEHLTGEEHDVVVIDEDEQVIQECEDTLDVLCVPGNGANAQTLIEAGVDKADILIAATASDEINMLCCLIGKRLKVDYTIARIRDPQYNESLVLLQQELGIDMTINPERATAQEISRVLRFPFASNVEPFAKGQVEIVEFRAQQGDMVVDIPLKDLFSKHRHLPRVLYAAVERDGKVTIPGGDFVIHAGDRVFVAGELDTVTSYFDALGKNKLRVRNVMIIGGGRISYYLAKFLTSTGIHATIMEINPQKAKLLSDEL